MDALTPSRLLSAWLLVWLAACGGAAPPSSVDAGTRLNPTVDCLDSDGDGVPGTGACAGITGLDCADTDPSIHPGATEVCNGLDDDCDGQMDEGLEERPYYRDQDGDGYGSVQTGAGCALPQEGFSLQAGDCNDLDATRSPAATEACNAADDDCDGQTDEGLPTQAFYPDADGDGFGAQGGAAVQDCRPSLPGRAPNADDCNDADATRHPGAPEFCNKVDDNCDGQVDNGVAYLNYFPDADGDGFGAASGPPVNACNAVPGHVGNSSDCDDTNPNSKPGATELCDDKDNNCDGKVDDGLAFTDYYLDADGDGVGAGVPLSDCLPVAGRVTTSGDCDDASASVHPGATEACNAVDDDCDGTPDDGLTFAQYYVDADGDGFGAAAGAPLSACAAVQGRVADATDCDDANVNVRPGAAEACNAVDDDCDGQVDDSVTFTTWYLDADEDGHGAAGTTGVSACAPVPGRVTTADDCDDTRASAKPGAAETCNGEDDDCDGQVDEALPTTAWYADADSDGAGAPGTAVQSCKAVQGRVSNADDCDDTRAGAKPGAPEQCNALDDDCDGQVDESVQYLDYFPDVDGDGYGAVGAQPENACNKPAGKVANAQDCDDAKSTVNPGAPESCNGADDNCSGAADEGLSVLNYYPDLDSDGFGSLASQPQAACGPVPGKVSSNTDCDDTDATVNPGRAEACNGVDDNCSGAADEGLATQDWYVDLDGDGYGAASGAAQASCNAVAGRVANALDCDDSKSNVKPGAAEACNGADDDCDGQVDEGNPGGGAACDTGQLGTCAAGTRTCEAGALACTRNALPSAESCDGLDNDCDGTVDETFTNKGQACTAGLGVCARTGTHVCAADGQATTCSATPGAPTAAACDGLDNDCDGVVDDPAFTSTAQVQTTAWTDLEVVPYHYTASTPAYGCNGGLVSTAGGGDVLVAGWLVMAGGTEGISAQKLNTSGVPVGSPVVVSGLKYSDVAAAQARDGLIVAGIWEDSAGLRQELDLYFVDGSTGQVVDYLYSQFQVTGTTQLDSLRVVRGSSGKVTLLWRETGVGLKLAQVKRASVNGAWTFQSGTGGALSASVLVSNASMMAGVGADSNVQDWASSISCADLTSTRLLGVSYVAPVSGSSPAKHTVRHFTVNEDGTGKSTPETEVASHLTSEGKLGEPEVAFYRYAGKDHWLTAYTESDTTYSPQAEDLLFYMTSSPGWNYAWVELATANGADSIQRPRVSFSGSEFWFTGLRYVADASGFKRQAMTRKVDLAGVKLPAGTATELPATEGACAAGNTDCRPGNKAGLVTWAAKGRVYCSASGATPSGTYAGALSCQ